MKNIFKIIKMQRDNPYDRMKASCNLNIICCVIIFIVYIFLFCLNVITILFVWIGVIKLPMVVKTIFLAVLFLVSFQFYVIWDLIRITRLKLRTATKDNYYELASVEYFWLFIYVFLGALGLAFCLVLLVYVVGNILDYPWWDFYDKYKEYSPVIRVRSIVNRKK